MTCMTRASMIVAMAFAPPADTAAPACAECYDKTAHCHRSTDLSHLLWSNGQQEPATFLRVSVPNGLRHVNASTFQISTFNVHNVHTSIQAIGVTCGDLIEQLLGHLQRQLHKEDREA